MPLYPKASQVQRYDSKYSGRYRGGPFKIVLHTTEGRSWPSYSGGSQAPHFTINLETGDVRQHFDTNRPSRALVNRSGGVQTNNDSAIQIEILGTSGWADSQKNYPKLFNVTKATPKQLQPLADLVSWICKTHGVRLRKWRNFQPWNGKDERMPYSVWDSFDGVTGHSQVPENTHSDPGALNLDLLFALASGLGTKVSVPSKSSTKVAPSKPSGKIAPLKVDSKIGRASAIALQLFLNSKGAKLKVDGKLGYGSWRALQTYLKTPVDGRVSHQSHRASYIGYAITQGWRYEGPRSKGSKMVRALQEWVGASADGVWGRETSRKLQIKLNAIGVCM